MRTTLIRLHVLGAILLFALPASGEDEPLPKGAKVRIAPKGLAFRYGARFTLLSDGKTLLVSSTGGTVLRFDVLSGKAIGKHEAAPMLGMIPVVSGDGKRAIIPNSTLTVVRNTETNEVVRELKSETPLSGFASTDAVSASFSHDGKVLARLGAGRGGKHSMIVWDVEKGDVIFQPELAHAGPSVPILSPDGKLLATRPLSTVFGQKQIVQVWDIGAKKELFQAQLSLGLTTAISAVAFSPDGGLLAASCADGIIDVWDLKTGKLKVTLVGRTRQGWRLAFSPDSKVLAAVSGDGVVQRWNLAEDKSLGTTDVPTSLPVIAQGLVFVNNDRLLAWGLIGPCPIVWEVPGKVLTPVPEQTSVALSMGFVANGKELITAGLEGRVVRWDTATGKPLGEIVLRPSRSSIAVPSRAALDITRDGAWGVALGNPSTVYDLTTGLEEFVVPMPLGFTGTSHTYLASDNTKAVRVSYPSDKKKPTLCTVWDLSKRQKLGEVEIAALGEFPRVALSPDATRLVTAHSQGESNNRTLVVTGWDIKNGKKLGQFEEKYTQFISHVVAISNSTALVASIYGRLRAYDYELGRAGDEIEPDNLRVLVPSAIAASADRKRFAYGVPTKDPNTYGVRVYDWPSGKAIHTFAGHRAPVRTMTFSPDGKILASTSEDTTVLLWDLSDLPAPK